MRTKIGLFFLVVATACAGVCSSTAQAQHYQPFGPVDVYNDLQMFAPPIIDEYGDEPVAPNFGWFFEYNRVYLNLNRREDVTTSFQGDFTWGNRIEFGYMTEEDHGWLATIWHVNSALAGYFYSKASGHE